MGRKIPGKKHRGVKNPHEQERIRKESIKNKINAPPEDIDDQPIPESLKRLAQWKKLGRKEFKKRKQDKKKCFKSWLVGDEPEVIPQEKKPWSVKSKPASLKLPGESEKDFIDRTFKETSQEMIQESKKSLSLTDEPGKSDKKKKGDMEQIILNPSGKKVTTTDDEEHVSKKDRMKLVLAAKKQAKLDKLQELQDEKDLFRDNVEFGEVVHAPPVLSLPARNKTKIDDAKLGKRKLILNELMPTKQQQQEQVQRITKKMKNMTPEERAELESIRLKAVESYRRMKAKKTLRVNPSSTS